MGYHLSETNFKILRALPSITLKYNNSEMWGPSSALALTVYDSRMPEWFLSYAMSLLNIQFVRKAQMFCLEVFNFFYIMKTFCQNRNTSKSYKYQIVVFEQSFLIYKKSVDVCDNVTLNVEFTFRLVFSQ